MQIVFYQSSPIVSERMKVVNRNVYTFTFHVGTEENFLFHEEEGKSKSTGQYDRKCALSLNQEMLLFCTLASDAALAQMAWPHKFLAQLCSRN